MSKNLLRDAEGDLFMNPIGAIGSAFGTGVDVLARDAGHALNAGNNLLAGYGLHAPATAPTGGYAAGTGPNSMGTQLIDWAHSQSTNPGTIVDLSGMTRPVASFTPTAQPTQADTGTVGTNGSTNPSYTGNYYGSGVGVGSGDWNAFKGIYDAELGNMQNQMDALPAYQDASTGNVQLQYSPQFNTLQAQHASGAANLDLAQNQLDTQRSQGLRNLGNSLRTALNGYQNQIGVMGAGNSSAAPLIGYALSQQGNRQMADMNTGFNQQQTGLNQQRNDLETNYQNQMDTLNAWKQSQLNQIAQQYAQSQAALQQQIMGANANEAQYLAMYGQTALANQAIQNMQALEQQFKDQVGQLNTHFSQVNAPIADISRYSGPYSINQITPGQLTPLSFAANQDNSAAPTAAASLLRRPDQTTQSNFGF